jgi:hypothetical protein
MGTGFAIDAVVPCERYGDFLEQTLPRHVAARLFDRAVVVTTLADRETRRVCEEADVECVTTGSAYDENGHFVRGALIDDGLQYLFRTGGGCNWVLVLDADIALPLHAREVLEGIGLNPAKIYGIDRHPIIGGLQWARYQSRRWPRGSVVAEAPGVMRIGLRNHGGWFPIGFFQLFCPSVASQGRFYPHRPTPPFKNTDPEFAVRWQRSERELIPEIIGAHLLSQRAPFDANWKGRTTRRFVPFSGAVPGGEPVGPLARKDSAGRRLGVGQQPYFPLGS